MDRSRLISMMKRIRTQYLKAALPPWDPTRPSIYFEETFFRSQSYMLPLIVLKTPTCRWLSIDGGCTTCNYQIVSAITDERKVSQEDILTQVNYALARLEAQGDFPFVHLTSSGSFMDPLEISDRLMVRILDALNRAGVEVLAFETRPEFLLDRDRLELVEGTFNGDFSVGIGLESSNDFIRRYCLNKAFKTETYVRATQALKDLGMEFYPYILLGKPFLRVKEDVEDAVTSIKFGLEHGARMAILMVANLQPHTLTYQLWEHGMYKLPKLWAALAVLEELTPAERKSVTVKAIDKAIPVPERFATNCPACTPRVRKAISRWELTGDYSYIEELPTCTCRAEWQEDYESLDEEPLERRIQDCLERIEREMQK